MHIPCEGRLRALLVAHTRLEASDLASKVPQPGVESTVDLVNMAAPPPRQGWASTIGTAALKSVLLLAAVLMWNS